jgi:ribosome biogenesis protein Nip4
MKPIEAFASKFGSKIALNPELLVEKNQRYYMLNTRVHKVAQGDFFYAGLYLGKVKDRVFFPSFNFLNLLLPLAANRVVLGGKAAWLFICGRDVFRKGVTRFMGSQRKGDFTLVLNEFGECLGFAMIVLDVGEVGVDKVLLRNVLDVGDFLRREQ